MLLVTARDGEFYLCHVQEGSGYVHADNLIPATFPCTYCINDKLPIAAKIRVRTAPNNVSDTIIYLVPGSIFTVVSLEGDWLRVISHEFVGKIGYVLQKSTSNVILAVPAIPKVFLQIGSPGEIPIRSKPSDDGPIISSVPTQGILGVRNSKLNDWILMNGNQFDATFNEAFKEQFWVCCTDKGKLVLQDVPASEINLCRLTRKLPPNATVRVRKSPSHDAPETSFYITREVLATLATRKDGWVFVVAEGMVGWMFGELLKGDPYLIVESVSLENRVNGYLRYR